MLNLSPGYTFLLTLFSTASFALMITFIVSKKHKIPNPIFSLARGLAIFMSLWLLWGSMLGTSDSNSGTTQIGLLAYLNLQHTKTVEQWLTQPEFNFSAFILTLGLSCLIILSLSFLLARLAAISDRRR